MLNPISNLRRSRWIVLLPLLFGWNCAKPAAPPPPFAGDWENTHAMKGGQFITQIGFDPSGSGQVKQISHLTGRTAKKTANTAAIRPMHWHSDGEHYVILLYQPEGSGQVRLEWSISNDGKVLSLIHTDNSTDVYYRPGAQGSSEPTVSAGIARGDLPAPKTNGTSPGEPRPEATSTEVRAGAIPAETGPLDREKQAESYLEKL
jgi:hypothetical protein